MNQPRPPGLAELEALTGISFAIVDDVDRAIKVMSSGAPRPPRCREPDELEQLLAASIDCYRYQQEVMAVAGDEVDDDEFWSAWRDLCAGPVCRVEDLRAAIRRLCASRADNVDFLLEHIREQRRAWLAGVPRITSRSTSTS